MTAFNIGNTMQDLTFYKLQQQTQQLIQQQNAYLAAQLQLARSHSVSSHNQQSLPTTTPVPSKQPAQRTLSDISYQSNQRVMDTLTNVRTPPGLNHSPSSAVLLASLPQTPCISIQRRNSTKSDSSLPSASTESATRYKTERCRPFEETGHCRYGSKCQFAHGDNEMRNLNRHPRYKTELCRTFHTTGFCSYGQRCNFIHNEDERRPAQTSPVHRPSALPFHPRPLTGSSGSSPASSVYGDPSPSHSPSYLSDDPFSPNTCSRLSPAPSLSSFTSDLSGRSFPSPPGTPPYLDEFTSMDKNQLSSTLDLSALLNSLAFRQ